MSELNRFTCYDYDACPEFEGQPEPAGCGNMAQARQYLSEFKNPRQSQHYLAEAQTELMKVLEQDASCEVYSGLARAYAFAGDLNKARRYCDKVMALAGASTQSLKEVYEVEADIALRRGDYKASAVFLKKAMSLVKPWQRLKLGSALCCMTLAQNAQENGFSSTVAKTGLLALGMTMYAVSQPVSQMAPMVAFYQALAANTFATPEKALERLMAIHTRYPGLEHLSVEIGKQFMKREQYTEAEFWFFAELNRYPTSDDAYMSLVQLYQATASITELESVLSRWMRIRPNNAEVMYLMAQALCQQPERLGEALEWAQKAQVYLTSKAQQAQNAVLMGGLYSALGQVDAAIVAYQSAITLNPKNLEVYISLGTLYYDKQAFSLSQSVFEKALALDPDNARILCNLGYLAWMQENIQQSLEYYHRSIALDPNYDIALNNLGVLYLDHLGDLRQAMSLFDQTLEVNPHYALCHYNKGRAYSFLGDTIEAARCYQVAQDLNQHSHELDSRELADRISQLFDSPTRVETEVGWQSDV